MVTGAFPSPRYLPSFSSYIRWSSRSTQWSSWSQGFKSQYGDCFFLDTNRRESLIEWVKAQLDASPRGKNVLNPELFTLAMRTNARAVVGRREKHPAQRPRVCVTCTNCCEEERERKNAKILRGMSKKNKIGGFVLLSNFSACYARRYESKSPSVLC